MSGTEVTPASMAADECGGAFAEAGDEAGDGRRGGAFVWGRGRVMPSLLLKLVSRV